MRNRVITATAITWGLAVTAAAQSGAKVTLPPNSRQTGAFSFVNRCPTAQTFKANSQPQADWLRFDPATLEAAPGISFILRLMANSGNRPPGTYRTTVQLICVSCAASNPPCFQNAKELSVELTVANVRMPSEFEPIFDSPAPAAAPASTAQPPAPYVPPDPPPPSANRLIPVFAGALVVVGALGMVSAVWALSSGREVRLVSGRMSVESERHQVRR